MSYGSRHLISEETRIFTLNFIMASLIVLVWLLYFTSLLVKFNVDLAKYNVSSVTSVFLFLASFLLIAIKLVSVNDIPLITALLGDPALAALQKSEIMRGESGVGGFMIGYLFEYFHLITLAYLFLAKKEKRST